MPQLRSLQAHLPSSTALLVLYPLAEHCPGEFCGVALVVDDESVRGWRFGVQEPLAGVVASAELLDFAGDGERDLTELGRHFFPEEWQQGQLPERVVIVASESLARVPLHAARLGDGRRLVEATEVSWAPSATVWSIMQPSEARWSSIVIFDGGVPGSDRVGQALRDQGVRTEVVSRSFSRLADVLSARRTDALVIWCHGGRELGSDARNVFRVGNHDTDALILAQMQLPPVVIVGACWSGAFSGQGDISPWSLLPAALLGGAQAVVMAMWEVPIESTAALLTEVVQLIQSQSLHVPQALGNAQAARSRRNAPVEDWAGLFSVAR